MPIGDNRGP